MSESALILLAEPGPALAVLRRDLDRARTDEGIGALLTANSLREIRELRPAPLMGVKNLSELLARELPEIDRRSVRTLLKIADAIDDLTGGVDLRTLAAFGTAYILPSVDLDQFTTAIWLAVLLALLNSTLRPLLILLTIPLTVFSFGLFLLVINAGLVMLASDWVEGFGVGGFWSAMAFSLLYSTISSLLEGQWMLRVMRARRRPF